MKRQLPKSDESLRIWCFPNLRSPMENSQAIKQNPSLRFCSIAPSSKNLRRRKILAPGVGIEPTTNALTAHCSTAELPGNTVKERSDTARKFSMNQSHGACFYGRNYLSPIPSPFSPFFKVRVRQYS